MTMLALAELFFFAQLATTGIAGLNKGPHVVLSFDEETQLEEWTSQFLMTTASGARYEVHITFARDKFFDERTMQILLGANWMAECKSDCVRIYGARTLEGGVDRIQSLELINRGVEASDAVVGVRSAGRVKVQTKNVQEKALPPTQGKPLSTGPSFGHEPFVEFDCSTFPIGPPGMKWDVAWLVYGRDGAIDVRAGFSTVFEPQNPQALAQFVLREMSISSCRAELVGNSRVRVYGWVFGGRYIRARRAVVQSPDLHPEELPKVKNAGS